jgi:type VI secretion system protein VasD
MGCAQRPWLSSFANDGRSTVNLFVLRRATAAALALLLAACASAPKPTQVAGTIEASPQVNPSTSRRASPVLVRVYELKTAAGFNSADFMSLYQHDKTELGGDMLAKDEFVLAPGESKTFAKTLSPDTRFLGVLAAYRDVEHARWRSVVPVQPAQMNNVVIRASELAIEAAVSGGH